MNENAVLYVVVALVGLVVFFGIIYSWYRYIFSIRRQLWNQKQTVSLLAKIAEKSGAINSQEAEEIIRQSAGKDDELK